VRTLVTRSPDAAARFIRSGEIVAFPTETVYGLGANLFDESAVAKIFAAKQRPADNPLIAHIASVDEIERVAREIPPVARRLVDEFFPGPLTLVLPKRAGVPSLATAGLDSIGVRMPAHPTAHAFLVASGTPIAAPSANRSGRPSPTTWEAVRADLDGRIACILEGDRTAVGLESTVVDCTSDRPLVLRAGAVTLEALRRVEPATELGGPLGRDDAPRSPGAKHRHYAPRAAVLVGSPSSEPPTRTSAYIGLDAPRDPGAWACVRTCTDVVGYARDLFAFFRECDDAGADAIVCQAIEPVGLGLAVMDRITRAADRSS
jgi:L-threonylcarbamoyladenylate synthase